MGTFSALLAICARNSPVPGEFPSQRPVARSFDVFFVLRLNKRLSKQSWGWWLETLSHPLWHHRNVCVNECCHLVVIHCVNKQAIVQTFNQLIGHIERCTLEPNGRNRDTENNVLMYMLRLLKLDKITNSLTALFFHLNSAIAGHKQNEYIISSKQT